VWGVLFMRMKTGRVFGKERKETQDLGLQAAKIQRKAMLFLNHETSRHCTELNCAKSQGKY
jgi:hypothetical protein